MFRAYACIAILALLASTGCTGDPTALSGLAGAIANGVANSTSGTVALKVYAPATQVALIAAGGLNYRLAARADEAPVPGAKITAPEGKTAFTDTTGVASLELAGEQAHRLTVSYKRKDGKEAVLPALALTHGSSRATDLDAANAMLAAGYASGGKALTPEQLAGALAAFSAAVAGASRVPEFHDEASAKAAFESLAPASVKEQLGL
jgi:hypothetical protein